MALCDYCQKMPRYVEGRKIHPYCSKTCAENSKLLRSPNISSSIEYCNFCKRRPKSIEGTRIHDFCSKKCARQAGGARLISAASSVGANWATCQAPGCQNPAYVDGSGERSNYCSISHKTLGETLCLLCFQAPRETNSHFCTRWCKSNAEAEGPMILEVPLGHKTFTDVAQQFKESWRHTNSVCPPVRRVYKIISPASSVVNYNSYRDAVEARGKFLSAGRTMGNENRRWHGTTRVCNLGDKGQTQLCSTSRCSLCSIVRNSFDISQWGKKTNWGRFGKGIYTSSTSSKSNDYSSNECTSSLKAMLLNKVVVGKGRKLFKDDTTLTAPPAGYDSVLAEKGQSLNYDELVVYNNNAIRPSFLIMYEP